MISLERLSGDLRSHGIHRARSRWEWFRRDLGLNSELPGETLILKVLQIRKK